LRATAGVSATLRAGGLVVADNHVHHVAQWKRSYMPGIYWGGVGNIFRNNVVEYVVERSGWNQPKRGWFLCFRWLVSTYAMPHGGASHVQTSNRTE